MATPRPNSVTADGTVLNQYLACDGSPRTCVETDPPDVYNYLGDCGTIPTLEASAVGYVEGSICDWCLVVDDPGAGCTWAGCSTICFGDHQCPPGSICDNTLENLTPGVDSTYAVCKPGGPGVYGAGLEQCI